MHYYLDHYYETVYNSEELSDEYYCEDCGQSDKYLGYFETDEEFFEKYPNYRFE